MEVELEFQAAAGELQNANVAGRVLQFRMGYLAG
jgi:hypothetical protein